MQNYLDTVTKAPHGFINTVIGNLINQVMQTALVGRADIHAGAPSNRFTAA